MGIQSPPFFWLVQIEARCEVYAISGCTGMVLGPGCQSRNSFALLTYTHKDCCEAAYRDDYTGCLVGGQFNGRPANSGAVLEIPGAFQDCKMSGKIRKMGWKEGSKEAAACWSRGSRDDSAWILPAMQAHAQPGLGSRRGMRVQQGRWS